MKNLGSFIAILGLASIALFFFDYELKILGWINNWGDNIAWTIRGGLVVVGAVLFFMAPSNKEPEETA